jgi:hypothetical protein
MNTQSNKLAGLHARGTWRLGLELLGAALLLLGVVGRPQSANARLDPFYIVHGASYGKVAPRILFMLDTSGSMGNDITYTPNKLPSPSTKCWWDNCENEDAGVLQSRIHAARNVIATLAQANKDKAEFGLMTYATALPPSSNATIPLPCTAGATAGALVEDEQYRFTWVKNVNQPFSNVWKPNRNPFGVPGMWVLCGDNRPFPYLRHDDLGFVMPDDSDAPLPDMPLYLAESDLDTFEDPANYSRKVQWFPRFVGRRANLDCSDPAKDAIAAATYGDYDGNNLAQKKSNVCGRDFYYWPYVDGNPGYSFYHGLSEDNMSHTECDDNGAGCKANTSQVHRLGIARREPGGQAALYAPFYSEAALADNAIPISQKGPLTLDDAWLMFDGITSKTYTGGADVLGGTPMSTSLGVVENLVNINNQTDTVESAKPSLPWTNAVFGHTSVSSYLSFLRLVDEDALCSPVTLIIVSDGQPDPWNNEGGSKLYERLRSIRRLLGVKTYMVAFTQEVNADPVNMQRLHEIACAASGADSIPTPCLGGNTFANWDTCANPDDPENECAWLSEDHEQLAAALTQIIAQALSMDVPSGTPTLASDFQLADPNNPESSTAAIQTSISSYTEVPQWRGHIARGACNDEDPENPGQLAEYCTNAENVPIETAEVETFGPCPMSRVWDAGECLELTDWTDRRVYTHDYDNNVFRIAEPNGDPSAEFVALVNDLNSQGKLDPPLSNDNSIKADEIVAMTHWLLGKDMPEGWKLPGMPNAAPILIRRVPQYNANFLPTVGIRDPHCAGRRNKIGDNIPPSLEAFSTAAWGVTSGGGYSDHYDYTEAVLVGDDFGVLHAFHYDSGNELFGFVPLALLNNSRKLSVNGTAKFGQSDEIDEHVFGMASTVNNGWVYDDESATWRHLAVFGLGPGGSEILALDVSHMGRLQTDDPIEVVWTTTTTANAADYAETLGETWSRPALTYAARNDSMSLEPAAYLVFGSGYREGVGDEKRGRTVWVVDALTGQTVKQKAFLEPPDPDAIYDVIDDYAAISDIAVGSHCLSRYWGEMQEAYWADPAGRLYRWDLATNASDVTDFPHTADGGGNKWPVNPQEFAVALESARFAACQGDDDFSCSVGALGANSKGDVFTFSPAVVSANRIDGIDNDGSILPIGDRDQFLLALASGSPNDNVLDGGDDSNDFHSSIYLIADDHRVPNTNTGFDIPADGPITPPGVAPKFMRLPLNQIERTRTIIFPDGETEVETRNFSKSARPLRAPMVRVTGLANGGPDIVGEVFYISFTIYEPGTASCDSRWFNDETGEWEADPGATYEVTFRLVVENGQTFDFNSGYQLAGNYGDGFGTGGGLSGPVVDQADCEGENCGAVLKTPKNSPCDPNNNPPTIGGAISVQTGWSELEGFSPLEVQL